MSNPPPIVPDYSSPSNPNAPKPPGAVETLKVVADTVAGPNLRLKDNLITLFSCIAGVFLGAIVGAIIGLINSNMDGALVGAMAGAFIGLIVGLFGSGIYLMIYRAVRHSKGKHD